MSAIVNFNLDLSKIPSDKIVKGKKGNYVNLTMSINDETRYGNNTSVSLSQTKEERDAKANKAYIGNGQVVWVHENGITKADKEESTEAITVEAVDENDLPF